MRHDHSLKKRNLSVVVYLAAWVRKILRSNFNAIRAHYISRRVHSPSKETGKW